MKKRKPRPFLSRPKSSKSNKEAHYAALKAALSSDLTPSEYEAAVRKIARELGI